MTPGERKPGPAGPAGQADGTWAFWVDRGGTFTDIVARRPDGALLAHKLLSEDPGRDADATVAGIRHLLGIGPAAPLPAERVGVVKLGTTVATNALLERAGEPTVLVITAGFADALRIGYQHRPRLFDRRIDLPAPVPARVVEVDERVDAQGTVLAAPDLAAVRADLADARAAGLSSVAIVCVHGYRYPAHEQAIAQVAREVGFTQVSVSHEVSPLMKLVARGDTTVVDAYLSPVLGRYTAGLADELAGVPLMVMQSHGGLARADHLRGKDAILSGPAGGIVGMARTAARAGYDKAIGFDMGGTSTDVSHCAGELERVMEAEFDGVSVRAPMLAIHTVAAGGGSVVAFDGSRLRVGPRSAGARPGPRAYGHGGPLTLTDANVALGRIQAGYFPRVFGPGGDAPLDTGAATAGFAALAEEMAAQGDGTPTPEDVAAGAVEVAVANMANAIKKISVARGHDPTEYALVTFGGAGGQHACAVADALGISRVLVPALAGVLSAYGLGLADTIVMREAALDVPLDEEAPGRIAEVAGALEAEALGELAAEGAGEGARATHRVHLRYQGTDTSLVVPRGSLEEMRASFAASYRERFSFLMPDKAVVVEAVSVEAVRPGPEVAPGTGAGEARAGWARPHRLVQVHAGGRFVEAPLYRREDGRPGEVATGPAIIAEANATTVVEPGWEATVTGAGDLSLARATPRPTRREVATEVDPVRLEIFNGLFMAVAEQMGARLQATAHSVNIKERLDFSCAVFDGAGNLVANAPHMPVHLGSMGDSIRQVIARRAGTMAPGEAYALNDPYHGGTHLPDITVVSPVFDDEGADILFYVASRGHHAEIGGLTPGSMPPFSRTIEEEGVAFDNHLLVAGGQLLEAETRAVLTSGPYPSRDPEANLADLRAQVAANAKGAQELTKLVAHFGLPVVAAYMGHVQANAEEAVRRAISKLADGHYRYDHDAGFAIEVAIGVDREARSATVDFTGTSPVQDTNFNAPSSVARAAVLYVFRTLLEDDIPLNDGCLVPLDLVIPEGCLLAPRHPSATVAGNVETSQAVTGALYGALGLQGEGSGTMNNVSLGNEDHQYYETVGSGSGAGEGFCGADVVQTHMTNSRLTDPEVLEWRYPVLVEGFSIRPGTGGAGRWRGGNGGLRRLRFLEDMTASVVSGHRRVPPYGMAGGGPGARGANWVERRDGTRVPLGGCDSLPVAAGDVLVVATPGGGGYRDPEEGP